MHNKHNLILCIDILHSVFQYSLDVTMCGIVKYHYVQMCSARITKNEK